MRNSRITKNLQTFLLIASATLIVPLLNFCNFVAIDISNGNRKGA